MNRKIVRYALRCLAAVVILGLLCLAVFGTFFEREITARERALSAEELLFQCGGSARISVVYAPDVYAANGAVHLCKLLNTAEGIRAAAVPEDDYALEDAADLTVFIGCLSFFSEKYLNMLARIGTDGLEIRRTTDKHGRVNTVYISGFSEEPVNRGIAEFAEAFLSEDGVSTDFYRTETVHREGELPEIVRTNGGGYTLCAVGYPGTDMYSQQAMSVMVSLRQADSLLFFGTPDLGNDYVTVSDTWQRLFDTVAAESPELLVYASENSNAANLRELTADAVRAVLPTESGALLRNSCRMYVDTDGEPLALEFYLNTPANGEDPEAGTEMMRAYARLADRASTGGKTLMTAFLPAVPTEAAALLPKTYSYERGGDTVFFDPYEAQVSSSADALYAASLELGVTNFVMDCGYNNTGVMRADRGGTVLQFGICGSIGFQNPGIGGRFKLNHSLRGLLELFYDFAGTEGPTLQMHYYYASDYGLTEKNAG